MTVTPIRTKTNGQDYVLDTTALSDFCRGYIGNDLHTCRMECKKGILECAEVLGVDYREIEAMECQQLREIDLNLYFRLMNLFNCKVVLRSTFGDDDE